MSRGSVLSAASRSRPERTRRLEWNLFERPQSVGAALLAGAIFCLDAFTRDDLAVAGLYVLVPLIAASGGRALRRVVLGWAIACAALAIIGFVIFQARGAPPLAAAHLGISLVVLLVTTLLLLRTQAMGSAVERGERRYRSIFDTLASAIWEHDFTEVVDAIGRLRASGVEDLRLYVAEHPEFVAEMRRRVRITDVNATGLALMGVPTKEAFHSRLSELLPETDESFADCIVALDERRPLFETETTVYTLAGSPRDIFVTFSLGPDACLDKVPGSILDVTERKALEAQVLRTREELAEAQRTGALAAMSASIAHELNQPLSAIHSYADAARRWMARTPPDMHEAAAALTGLSQAIGHARTVMHRVRSLVGNARIRSAEIDLGELLSTTVTLMRADAAEASTRLVLMRGRGRDLAVSGDRILLKQVFVNLVSNAIQAMAEVPPDCRTVTVEIDVEDGTTALVRVADRGPGWEDAEAKVFGSFYTTKPAGMGLGLSISRTTIERHGGSIALGRAQGGGALVEVRLPLSGVAPSVPDGADDGRVEQVAVEGLV
jgi:two-component system, LuxR family, sensor kinase FixL